MKNLIEKYKTKFFGNVESVVVEEPKTGELLNGKAFDIRYFSLGETIRLHPEDSLRLTYTPRPAEPKENAFVVKEQTGLYIDVTHAAIFRFKDALGFKNAIGAVFGER